MNNIENLKSKIDFNIKFWLEFEGKSILGAGWANLLKTINKKEVTSLTQAAKECGYSYKYAWNILKRIEERTTESPVLTSKGGPGGGGSVELNEWGHHILQVFEKLEKEVENIKENLKI
ncbi:MAG: ModE family transcriptional regulator [Promethearchaeota archaeon]|nr:MAG: ModE family transcriptional regulator [Candidatus Lokiarchaeota archaeon]